jgi:radical SAM-linked protein
MNTETTRIRIRFRKEGDLRWISHRDLARAWERAFRRANLRLKRTQGFHPKDKMSFPLALSLGIVGAEELLEVEITDNVTADQIEQRLRESLPAGLAIVSIEVIAPGTPKPKVAFVVYEVPIPVERSAAIQEAIETLLQQSAFWIERTGRDKALDLRADIVDLQLRDDVLMIKQQVTGTATANPREILAAVGVDENEQAGYIITRTKVEITQ